MTKRLVPFLVFSTFVVYLAASVVPLSGRTSGFDSAGFGRLPVSVNGRVQPFDSVARIGLLQIRGSGTVPLDGADPEQAHAKALDANQWLLEVLAKPDTADTRKIFPVHERELLEKLQIQPADHSPTYCAFRDIAQRAGDIGKETERVSAVAAGDRAAWERELLTLRERLIFYERFKNSLQPNTYLQHQAKGNPFAFDFADELAKYRKDLAAAIRIAAARKQGSEERLDLETEQRLRSFSRQFQIAARTGSLAVIPPAHNSAENARWSTIGVVIANSARGEQPPVAVSAFANMSSAFAKGNAEAFNNEVTRYHRWLGANGFAVDANRAGFEAWYNVFQPFSRALVIYALGLVLLVAGWRTRSRVAYRSAVAVIGLGFIVHTAGLAFVMSIAGRPTAVAFAAWGMTLALLAAEAFWRRGFAIVAASSIALVALATAHALTPGGLAAIVDKLLDVRLAIAVAVALGALVLGREAQTARRPMTFRAGAFKLALRS